MKSRIAIFLILALAMQQTESLYAEYFSIPITDNNSLEGTIYAYNTTDYKAQFEEAVKLADKINKEYMERALSDEVQSMISSGSEAQATAEAAYNPPPINPGDIKAEYGYPFEHGQYKWLTEASGIKELYFDERCNPSEEIERFLYHCEDPVYKQALTAVFLGMFTEAENKGHIGIYLDDILLTWKQENARAAWIVQCNAKYPLLATYSKSIEHDWDLLTGINYHYQKAMFNDAIANYKKAGKTFDVDKVIAQLRLLYVTDKYKGDEINHVACTPYSSNGKFVDFVEVLKAKWNCDESFIKKVIQEDLLKDTTDATSLSRNWVKVKENWGITGSGGIPCEKIAAKIAIPENQQLQGKEYDGDDFETDIGNCYAGLFYDIEFTAICLNLFWAAKAIWKCSMLDNIGLKWSDLNRCQKFAMCCAVPVAMGGGANSASAALQSGIPKLSGEGEDIADALNLAFSTLKDDYSLKSKCKRVRDMFVCAKGDDKEKYFKEQIEKYPLWYKGDITMYWSPDQFNRFIQSTKDYSTYKPLR